MLVTSRSAGRHRFGGLIRRLAMLAGFGLSGLVLAGCTTNGSGGPMASAGNGTVAFESIDGPPQALFDKLVATLGQEAEAQSVPVVSRQAAPAYRVRTYLAAHVERGKTSIAWVLDVYDAERQRALRISGQEPGAATAGGRAADAWSAADERVLRRIAQTGMARIATFLRSPSTPDLVPMTPDSAPVAIAFASEASTDAAQQPQAR